MKYSEKDFKSGIKFISKISSKHAKLSREFKLDFSPKLQRSPYESLVRAIAHQQLHGKAAETILKRFTDLYQKKKFPTPLDIIKTPDAKLRACGFSTSKTKSIKDIAQKTLDGVVPEKKQIMKM